MGPSYRRSQSLTKPHDRTKNPTPSPKNIRSAMSTSCRQRPHPQRTLRCRALTPYRCREARKHGIKVPRAFVKTSYAAVRPRDAPRYNASRSAGVMANESALLHAMESSARGGNEPRDLALLEEAHPAD